jgi:hypothetical protein
MLDGPEILEREIKVEYLVRPEFLLQKLDGIDFIILKRFYLAGPKPHDTCPWLQITLRNELERSSGINLSVRAVGIRLKRLVELGLLKERNATPKLYFPKEELKIFVRKLIRTYSTRLGVEVF